MSVDAAERSRLEAVIISRLPALLEEVRDRLEHRWPEYADFLATDEDGVVEAIERATDTYVALREEGERFLDTYRRVGMQPFKEAIYG